MSLSEFDVAIVSCFDRCYWLAAELQSRGMRVCFIDVTEDMGLWPPEDIEGPFGYFAQDKMPASYLKIVDRLTALKGINWGLCVWASSQSFARLGPIQMKSPIFREQMAKLKISLPDGESITAGSFSENWLKLFCQQFGLLSVSDQKETISHRSDEPPLNAMKDFMIRTPVRNDYQKLRQELIHQGVTFLSGSEIVDLSFLGSRSINGIELKKNNSGLLKLGELVWCLNSEETKFLNGKLFEHLFSRALDPVWSWVRYRIRMTPCFELGLLPDHFVMIREIFEPWNHANMMIVQRTPVAEQMDFWLKIPSLQRFNKSYLRFRELQVKEAILSKLPLSQPEILSYPQEYFYTMDELGPSLYSEYDFKKSSRVPEKQFKNVSFIQSIQQIRYSLYEKYALERKVLDQLTKRWEMKLEQQRKNDKKKQDEAQL